ncbi:MAG: ABC transporter ATP-binding protein [Acidobacteriota bacterium]
MEEMVVDARGLSKRYGELRAVRDLNFSVNRGEMFCLVGPDGAGKTTTIKLLSGITRPSDGRARIFGFDLVEEAEKIKPRIGYLSQRFTLYGDLTVDENIEFFAGIHEVRNYGQRREELLGFTRLAAFRRRLAEHLSGGMKQKLALACTLIHTPDLLLLDEPTTGVDVVSRREFWKILSGLLERKLTILITTPYMDEAERAGRVALMHRGAFAVVETPAKVKSLMRGEVVEVVCPELRRAAAAAKRVPEVVEVQMFGDRVHVVVMDADRDFPGVRSRLLEEGIDVSNWRRLSPSLENVFISLTQTHPEGLTLDSRDGQHG